MSLAATATIAAILLQGGTSDASTVRVQPSLSSLVAEAAKLSNEVDSLGQQYDGLKIQMSHAKTEERLAQLAATRAATALAVVLLQGGASDASTVRVQPSLTALVAEATKLSNEVDSLKENDRDRRGRRQRHHCPNLTHIDARYWIRPPLPTDSVEVLPF